MNGIVMAVSVIKTHSFSKPNQESVKSLAGLLETFQEYHPEIREVNYELQRSGNKMFKLTST